MQTTARPALEARQQGLRADEPQGSVKLRRENRAGPPPRLSQALVAAMTVADDPRAGPDCPKAWINIHSYERRIANIGLHITAVPMFGMSNSATLTRVIGVDSASEQLWWCETICVNLRMRESS